MAGILRNTIVVAMGAGALGGPDALRLLLEFAGRSPVVDIAIVVFVIAAVTAPALGTMLLARFFRKPRSSGAGGGATRSGSGAGTGGGATRSGSGAGATGAAAADPFAKMTLVLSLAVAFLVSASLLLLSLVQSGDLAPLAFAGAALVVGASAARVCGVLLPNAHGAAGAAPTAPAVERVIKATLLVSLSTICLLLLVPRDTVSMLVTPAQSLLAFAFNNPLANLLPVGVATATVVGATLVALFLPRAQNAAVTATAALLPATERFPRMILVTITPLAVAFFLAAYLLAAPPVA